MPNQNAPAIAPAATVLTETADPATVVTDPAPAAVVTDHAATPAPVVDPAVVTDPVSIEYTEFKAPDGMTLDTELLGQATPLFKELNLTQEQAQKLVDFQAANALKTRQSQQEAFTSLINKWQTDAKADKEFGGEKFEESVGIARLAVQKFGTPAFKQLMEDHGVGNHPEMIRFMLNIGRTLKEDVPGATGGAVSGKTDRVSILYPQP